MLIKQSFFIHINNLDSKGNKRFACTTGIRVSPIRKEGIRSDASGRFSLSPVNKIFIIT